MIFSDSYFTYILYVHLLQTKIFYILKKKMKSPLHACIFPSSSHLYVSLHALVLLVVYYSLLLFLTINLNVLYIGCDVPYRNILQDFFMWFNIFAILPALESGWHARVFFFFFLIRSSHQVLSPLFILWFVQDCFFWGGGVGDWCLECFCFCFVFWGGRSLVTSIVKKKTKNKKH